jgi:myo-inositol 2-dehydrogenase/D-chiro-inositol 1-dehydrogenase
LAIASLRSGKAVMCEKPLAPSVAECARVVQEEQRCANGHKGLISVGFMRRFDPAYLEMKAALETGGCGAPLLVHCISRGVSSAPDASDESSVTCSAIHEFDTVPWLLDSAIVEVSWHAPRSAGAVAGLRDPQLILLRTADGVLTTVETFLNAGYGYDIRCEVVGEQGTLALNSPGRLIRDSARSRSVGYADDWRPRFAEAYRTELQLWIDAVAVGARSPLATARDGLSASAVAAAVMASMRDGGKTVAVNRDGA